MPSRLDLTVAELEPLNAALIILPPLWWLWLL
jgi:hypothetical protein